MQNQRRRDTAPELALRRELHSRGRRFFVDRPPLTGVRRSADLLFPTSRVAVFVDGCFWHACPEHGRVPRSNGGWWREKLAGNAARDRDTDERLSASGWRVVRVWEHEQVAVAADRVEVALGPRGASSGARRRDRPAGDSSLVGSGEAYSPVCSRRASPIAAATSTATALPMTPMTRLRGPGNS